jgi:thioredoxin reductase (NADPH)
MEIGGLPLTTPYDKPTRQEALQYYRKVADAFQLQISLFEEVHTIDRDVEAGEQIFLLETRSSLGVRRVRKGRMIVLAMGYYDGPNTLNIPGEDLPHVKHYFDEPHPYYRRRVVIVGGKNSAVEAALELYRSGAHVTLVHRGPSVGDSVKYWVKPDIENRIRDGAIAARFNTRVLEIRPTEVVVSCSGWSLDGQTAGSLDLPTAGSLETSIVNSSDPADNESSEESVDTISADSVLLLTGYHADNEFLRRAGVHINP